MEDKLYKVAVIARMIGVTNGLIYQRIRSTNVKPIFVKGIMYFNEEDMKILTEYKRRGRPRDII